MWRIPVAHLCGESSPRKISSIPLGINAQTWPREGKGGNHSSPPLLKDCVLSSWKNCTMELRETAAPASDIDQEKGTPGISHVEKLREQQVMPEIDVEIERRVTRKFDLHIVPWLFGIW
jgi:hypothetical protein